jgi:hypothetical protein
MVSLTPYFEKTWKASTGEVDLFYYRNDEKPDYNEYVNGTEFCFHYRRKHCLDQFLYSQLAVQLINELKLDEVVPSMKILNKNSQVEFYIHPSLAPHMAVWIHPKFNYPVCKMLQAITNQLITPRSNKYTLCTKTITQPTTHSFTFYTVPDSFGMLNYYAVECPTGDIVSRSEWFRKHHPKTEIVFQQHEVPNSVSVMRTLKKLWKSQSRLAVGRDNFCSSQMCEMDLCDYLRSACCSDKDPSICRGAYDVVDCCYDQVL